MGQVSATGAGAPRANGAASLFSFGDVSVADLGFRFGNAFEVGGERGWAPPQGNETETYNEWAEQHRFHIGDTVYFNYQDDSVLLVNHEGYENCDGSNPIQTFGVGGATLKFDRHGFFYFISENQGNCEAGQRIIIRVMVQNVYHSSSPAPAPSPSGSATDVDGSVGDGNHSHSGLGRVPHNSAGIVSVTSYLMTTVTLVVLILHLIMH